MTRTAREVFFEHRDPPPLPVSLSAYHSDFRLFREGQEIRYQGPDLHLAARKLGRIARASDASAEWKLLQAERVFSEGPRVTQKIVMVTGSHHYLALWVAGGPEVELRQFPFVFLLRERKWIKRDEAFLQPPDAVPQVLSWNSNCIQCHAVAGRPEQSEFTDPDSGILTEIFRSSTADLGIACESCHGPGGRHVNLYRDPFARQNARKSGSAAHIFVPDAKSGERGSAACGQCHSYFVPRDPEAWWTSGNTRHFVAGDSLEASRILLSSDPTEEEGHRALTGLSQEAESVFWPDGSIIVGGREYNALIRSPCYLQGEGERKLSCTSCHSMHEGEREGQLAKSKRDNQLCVQCHEDVSPDHSGHKPGSVGAECVNCHMPKTSYALLKAVRSHEVSVPVRLDAKPPNACVLCHVDRSRDWIEDALRDLFGTQTSSERESDSLAPPPAYDLPLALSYALSGNAAERALLADALGSPEAAATAGSAVADLVLPRLTQDPYAAVRFIAARSLSEVKRRGTQGPPLAVSDKDLADLISRRDNSPVVISE